MMMRPRHYSVMNRSIARGVSYALRDSNRKKYKRSSSSSTYSNNMNMNQDMAVKANVIIWSIAIILILCCIANS